MTTTKIRVQNERCVMAIDPTSRGFGFVVFEGTEGLDMKLIDWGVPHVRSNKRRACLRRIEELLDTYEPTFLILEHSAAAGSRRCARVKRLLVAIRALAARRNVKTRSVSRGAIHAAFSKGNARTKEEIAASIAARYPELAPRRPPPRKCWMPEDDRMSMFDAAALAHTFFHFGPLDRTLHLKRYRPPRATTNAPELRTPSYLTNHTWHYEPGGEHPPDRKKPVRS